MTATLAARPRPRRRTQEVCGRGHALAGHNVYTRPDGRRCCRRCHNDRRWYAAHGIAMVLDARSGETDAYRALLTAVLDRNISLDEARDVFAALEER